MSSRQRTLHLALVLYGLGAYALGFFVAGRPSGNPPEDVAAAQAAIRSLRLALDARGDTLNALRAARAAAAAADAEASAEAERVVAATEPAIAAGEARADSLGALIRAQVDSTVAAMVSELEDEHDQVVERLRKQVGAERSARMASARRVEILEASVVELEATVAAQAEIIRGYEDLDAARADQIRSLELQRAGGYLLAVGAIACAFLCGG